MSTEEQAEAVRRLKSIEGHVRGVTRMVKEDQYSLAIIQQIQAIQGALEKINLLILGAHLHECVATAVRTKDASEREHVIRELLDVFATSQDL